ncbi:hypothetical protein F3Y22_tig00111640pilonHSYRG00140 [Hibiscus syriacus]|uniref:Peptidase S8/S53 domain-containing protein n=1 Tax=Hibiscus syriacus TaxID=106335 RepID=A0A6A2XK31_HIBSY|nr:hypothetical protein F3Y22_tig00111640pilonHSYRG00140 [Hibiscus syriacus]
MRPITVRTWNPAFDPKGGSGSRDTTRPLNSPLILDCFRSGIRGLLDGAFENAEKIPGKIFTSMSFSEEKHFHHSGLSNSSINWSRHILMKRSQVTSLFGAAALWRKGYTCAEVKMAIFDTGIRADHPHF